LRLELLEGVVAYHTGQLEKSRKALASARAKFVQVCKSVINWIEEIRATFYTFVGVR